MLQASSSGEWHNKFYRSILSTPYLVPFPISYPVLISLLNANSPLNLQPDSHEQKIPFPSLLVMKKVFPEQNSLNGNFDIASCKKIPSHFEHTFQCTQLQLLRTGRKYAIAVYYGCRKNPHDRPTTVRPKPEARAIPSGYFTTEIQRIIPTTDS